VNAGEVRRIAVIGCSGSGKSTLASALAAQLGLPYVATDSVFWTADWRPTPAAEVRAWLPAATDAERWVTDGNFDADRDLLWARADLIVWLDLPLAVALGQALRRNLGWWVEGTAVWGGQRMTLAKALDGARHVLRSHGEKRRDYPGWLAHLEVPTVRISRPARLERWVGDVTRTL
jgi:energy-coupling factor transporter ATP-binding protein EcfA2